MEFLSPKKQFEIILENVTDVVPESELLSKLNSSFEKKVPKICPKMTKIPDFLISIVCIWPEMSDNRPISSKVPACPKFSPKFFISHNSKNW